MREVEIIAKTDKVRVRIMSLDPREIADWHYHTEVTDDIFCLTGTIIIRVQEPDEEYKLAPGDRCRIKTGRVHQLENLENKESTYLLVQGTGRYDFNVVEK
ncbi:MAG TPA: cupin domain-containing protein [Anaerolineales bacterium]